MPFGRKATGLTRVLEFGAREPREGLPALLDEMHRKNNLWNALVEIEHKHREETAALIRGPLDEHIDAVHTRLSEAKAELKMLRGKAAYTAIEYGCLRHRLGELVREWNSLSASREFTAKEPPAYTQIPELLYTDPEALSSVNKSIQEFSESLKPIYAAAKVARRARIEACKPELTILETRRRFAVKAAVKGSGAHWMNSEEVVKDYEIARKRAMATGLDLRFHSWTTEGKISVRYQHGRPGKEFYDEDTRLLVQRLDESAWGAARCVRRKMNHTEVKIRCGSNADRSPIWIVFTAYIHRPLAAGVQIQAASLVRRKVGLRYKYRLLVTVRCPEPAQVSTPRPTLAVTLNWKLNEDRSLQVATWKDSLGAVGNIVLPRSVVGAFDSLDELGAVAQEYQNKAADAVREITTDPPEWFKEATKTLAHWESPLRFLRLWREWEGQRFGGDETAFSALGQFRERFLHLYQWQCNLRDQLQLRRREMYRIFAAEAAKKYGTIHIDDRCLVSAGGGQLDTNFRKWTRMAASSVLRSTLKQTFTREGVKVEAKLSQIEAVLAQTSKPRTTRSIVQPQVVVAA